MRLATYNVWNSESGMPQRENYIIEEILNVKADVICLQEVRDKAQAENMADKAGYQYVFFDNYKDEAEGLCILSKVPFAGLASWMDSVNALFASFDTGGDEEVFLSQGGFGGDTRGKRIAVVNLHLPWDSALHREKQITEIVSRVDREKFDYVFLAGDFNCSDTSDVHRFLAGDCTLGNTEANPNWYDLAVSYADFTQTHAECTLNFRENPRFAGNTIEPNVRFDGIMLRNTYPQEFPALKECTVFGKKVYDDINLSASDHYGVVVQVE